MTFKILPETEIDLRDHKLVHLTLNYVNYKKKKSNTMNLPPYC